jgi:hypothetical protein
MSDDDHEPDAAAEAFEGVRGELALLRRAVERLAAERAEAPEIPDYSETLGHMAKAITATATRVDVLAKAAGDNVAPRYVADRIVAAGAHARDEDRRMIAAAGSELNKVARDLQGVVASARIGREQTRRLIWAVIGGAVLGMIMWAVLPGFVAREVAFSEWQWPEKMAARTLAMPMWEGGQRMMKVASPEAFANIAAGNQIVTANRQVLEACQKRANRARETVSCAIKINNSGKQGK